MKNGIPFDVAFKLDKIKRTAFSIALSEIDGAKFNWNTWRFETEK